MRFIKSSSLLLGFRVWVPGLGFRVSSLLIVRVYGLGSGSRTVQGLGLRLSGVFTCVVQLPGSGNRWKSPAAALGPSRFYEMRICRNPKP